ncbi:TraR/DksA family transcriptional regulator [Jiangella muralis]|uniref:TraR/DksA family transcriptional regulator n=1 Tax=Jiangella muralis TaxID=702383 RepID=UPI0009FA894C|nr:TraR/DksA C4-type zinc finger protein [Jiangella muralis]
MTAIEHAAPKRARRSGIAAYLHAIRADLRHQRRFRTEQLKTLDTTTGTGAARITNDALSQVTLELRAAAAVALADIDAALNRIASNRYGRCQECGTIIPMERLQALPMVRLCMTCQFAHEVERGDPSA